MRRRSKLIDKVKPYIFSVTAKQTLILASSQILFIALGVIVNIFNARVLGADSYGIFAFFTTIVSFSVLFFRFGFFGSGSLLLAYEKNRTKERSLIGALVIISLLAGLFYFFVIFIFSFFVDQIFKVEVGYIFRLTAPLLIFLPFQLLIPQIGKGTNNIKSIALFNIIPKVLYLFIVLFLLIMAVNKIDVVLLIFLHIFCVVCGAAVIIYSLKPLFVNLKENFKKLWIKNKEYGIHLYSGQAVDHLTSQLGSILISYFINTTQLGFYFLACIITAPMSILSQSLITTLFKGFAEKERIAERVMKVNLVWLSGCLLGIILLRRPIVVLFFTDKFSPVAPLILPLSLAAFFQGVYQPYIGFLSSKGVKQIKYTAYLAGVVSLSGNFILIPLIGTYGAAIAVLLFNFSRYLILLFLYKSYLKGRFNR